jgi:uncharacterized RDD family membrane protein YckC
MRFDEVELDPVPVFEDAEPDAPVQHPAHRLRRLAALLTDLSLFVALTFLLLPLLPQSPGSLHVVAMAGFVVMISYYYFVGSWMLGGKTVGGVIFDVRVVPATGSAMTLRAASIRWAGVFLSIVTLGLGFALAVLPSRLSLPDRMSGTHCE